MMGFWRWVLTKIVEFIVFTGIITWLFFLPVLGIGMLLMSGAPYWPFLPISFLVVSLFGWIWALRTDTAGEDYSDLP